MMQKQNHMHGLQRTSCIVFLSNIEGLNENIKQTLDVGIAFVINFNETICSKPTPFWLI
jgi:hypothetical protein